ncbi:polysaccharide biosynthesis protein [Aromatoleum toluclasticum]|uniref:polysaccharide biosynthesis protein n=1 Tax=Aromatoleum toluclasticum TaxID=92003 RepID=UPI000365B60C|nr:nucleoside-diphosphate sugar epimerase/dehydratase [Aromatoleum toluclasticum]
MKRLSRSALVLLFDLLAACAAWVSTYFLRFNFEWPAEYEAQIALGLLVLLPVHATVCTRVGLYRGIWVFASLPDLARVLRAVAISSLAVWAFVALYRASPGVPRSTLVLYPMLLVLIMAGGRAAYRMWKEHRLYGGLIAKGKPVVVVGAGRGGAMLLRELQRSPDWRVIGLVDDDADKWGRELLGLPVFGPVGALSEILVAERVEHVILAMPSAATKVRRAATDLAVRAGAKVFTVPGLEDVMAGRVAVSAIRRVDIEDLLGREPVWIDTPHVEAMLKDKVVLVTGAGGSIGSELCRQLARFAPRRVVLYELNEFALYNVEQWFANNAQGIEIVPLAGDVKDVARLDEVFAAWRPEVVFHAAAYKHVPLMEVANAWQAVRNNVLGTLRVGEAAQRHGAGRFILISTDKAVNPTNVMGASKRLAELVCQALQQRVQGTQFEMVRFGNVLGSTGSVIPKFQEQIARGGPITVTHPEINRYFMSIPEAAQLVLQAAAMGQGGEIFVMDMGDPVKIVDLARNMIRLSGYSEEEIRIEFTGLRPGEKLYEELLADSEETRETPHPKLRIARSVPAASSLLAELAGWFAQKDCLGDDEVRRALLRWVPEYVPMGGRPALRVVESREQNSVRARR